eukprot:6173330-Pleurochrysis_carterae.AAC.4
MAVLDYVLSTQTAAAPPYMELKVLVQPESVRRSGDTKGTKRDSAGTTAVRVERVPYALPAAAGSPCSCRCPFPPRPPSCAAGPGPPPGSSDRK